ncbi:LOW QUALITY PROTEIN: seed biotin-containing protein SBP65-like [Telopea speciosissima]|uniref:LOW QUALITY PROTEIN: seed biotin-containing protein SBP65-like n=1 Tax=Telopea speciosissima TaxID=54955 RepID=UPI001CC39107|nr:LOW QUALITY PROTEIN: seed biotin-containing protein SBP65-like [Telopea speciosissima]
MASEKIEKIDDSREIPVEKERVPKMTMHFESLAGKAKGTEAPGAHDERRVHAKIAEERAKTESDTDVRSNKETPSLSQEEIGKYRATAQQKSVEAIRNVEERKAKAKESSAAAQYAEEKGGAAKDTALEKGQQAYEYTAEKGQKGASATKDTLAGAGKNALNYTVLEAEKTKDVVVKGSEATLHYAGEKAAGAKHTAVNVAKSAASYAGETAVAAKDVTLEGGKKVAASAAQKATVVGLTAAEAAAAAGHKVAEHSAEKMASAKKAAEAKRQDWTEYTEEKQREGRDWGTGLRHRGVTQKAHEEQGGTESVGELLGAVGETVAEIAQRAKEMVIGGPPQQRE